MPRKEEAQVPLAITETDQRQVLELYQKIQRSRAKLVGPDGKTQNLPVSLYEFLVKLIADLCEGQSVAIVQNDAQLTTVEGARMLGVSRQFLIKLLERGEIPHHLVGTHTGFGHLHHFAVHLDIARDDMELGLAARALFLLRQAFGQADAFLFRQGFRHGESLMLRPCPSCPQV